MYLKKFLKEYNFFLEIRLFFSICSKVKTCERIILSRRELQNILVFVSIIINLYVLYYDLKNTKNARTLFYLFVLKEDNKHKQLHDKIKGVTKRLLYESPKDVKKLINLYRILIKKVKFKKIAYSFSDQKSKFLKKELEKIKKFVEHPYFLQLIYITLLIKNGSKNKEKLIEEYIKTFEEIIKDIMIIH